VSQARLLDPSKRGSGMFLDLSKCGYDMFARLMAPRLARRQVQSVWT